MSKLTAEEFVTKYMEAYKQGLTMPEFATSIGYNRTAAYNRVQILLYKGVNLPKLVRVRQINPDKLNQIIGGMDSKKMQFELSDENEENLRYYHVTHDDTDMHDTVDQAVQEFLSREEQSYIHTKGEES